MMRSGSLIGKDQMFISPKIWKSASKGSANAASRSRKRPSPKALYVKTLLLGLERGVESDFVGNHY